MAKTLIDRRAARTRERLERAHLALIRQKGYEALTIKDICAAANVGRSTFYAHYAGKDDLKRKSLDHLRRHLVARQGDAWARDNPPERCVAFSLPMFEHARDHIDLYRALVGTRGGDIALATIRGILCDLVRAALPRSFGAKTRTAAAREIAVQGVVGAYMAVLTWWLDTGAIQPPEDIDAAFRRLVAAGIAAPCG
jgi:AcrR family transcriptional regulator